MNLFRHLFFVLRRWYWLSYSNLSLSYLHLFLTFLHLNHSSNVILKLPHKKLSVFNIYRPPPSVNHRVPFSKFSDEFSSFLSLPATTPHVFIIKGDFNIHLDNPTDTITSQFLSVLSSFNLTQHVDFPTHDKNHILDLVITSSDSSLAPSPSTFHWSPSDHFPIFTKHGLLLVENHTSRLNPKP